MCFVHLIFPEHEMMIPTSFSIESPFPSLEKTHIHRIWVNYNDLTATSLEIMVNKGNHPQMALFQGSEIL